MSSQYTCHTPSTSSDVSTSNNGNIPYRCPCGKINSFPAGMRFIPQDHELIVHYLEKKVKNQPFPEFISRKIRDVELYKYSPDELTVDSNLECGEKFWYFFTPRDRKYKNGTRPRRSAGAGFWKATGADKTIKFEGKLVGHKKTLKYYRGKNNKDAVKTNWIMHELRLRDEPDKTSEADNMRLKGLVLCKIYEKLDKEGEGGNEASDRTASNDNADPEMNVASPTSTTVLTDADISSWEFPVYQTNDFDFGAPAGELEFQYQQDMKMHQAPAMQNGENPDSGASLSLTMTCDTCLKTAASEEMIQITGSSYGTCNNCFIDQLL